MLPRHFELHVLPSGDMRIVAARMPAEHSGGLDFPAFAAAYWAAYDGGQLPRPEYVLPVLATESGLQPSIPNQAGYPYYGINQASGDWLTAHGIDIDDYLTWPASQQLARVVAPMYASNQANFGKVQSGTLAYLLNFLPARMAGSHDLGTVLATKGDGVYAANTGLDYTGKGTITIGDLAHFISKAASGSAVQNAIAQMYAARPGESPRDPVYGTDYPDMTAAPHWWQKLSFGDTAKKITAAVAGAGLVLGGAYAATKMPVLLRAI